MDCISKFNNETILFNYLNQTLKQLQGSAQHLWKVSHLSYWKLYVSFLYAINIKQCLWRSALSFCCLDFPIVSLHLKSSVCTTKGKILQISNWQWKCLSWFSKAIKEKDVKSASSCQVQSSALEEKMWKGDRQNKTCWYTAQKIWGKIRSFTFHIKVKISETLLWVRSVINPQKREFLPSLPGIRGVYLHTSASFYMGSGKKLWFGFFGTPGWSDWGWPHPRAGRFFQGFIEF